MKNENKAKRIARRKGYTQQDVANAIMCATSTYAHYEKDERWMDQDTLIKLSKLFGVTTDHILYNDGKRAING